LQYFVEKLINHSTQPHLIGSETSNIFIKRKQKLCTNVAKGAP